MGLDTIAASLGGVAKRGNEVFYNNFLADIIANYIVFRAGDNYDELMRKIFQDKVKIKYPVSYEKHAATAHQGSAFHYYGQLQIASLIFLFHDSFGFFACG